MVYPRDPVGWALVDMKLRLYRDYSIKLMLAWETCCRSDLSSPLLSPFPPLLPSPHRHRKKRRKKKANPARPRIRHPVLVPGARHHRRRPGRRHVRPHVGASAAHLRRAGACHPPQVPRGLRPDRVGAPAVRRRHGAVAELPDARHHVPVHGVGAVGHRPGGQRPDGAQQPARPRRAVRRHDRVHL